MEGLKLEDMLDLPARILEKVVKSLQDVGIDLPPIFIQLFLLILVLVLLFLLMIHLRGKPKNPLEVLGIVGLGLIGFGIIFSWVEHAIRPFPVEIKGRIEVVDRSEGNPYIGMRVKLLDSRDQEACLGTGSVDTTYGTFALTPNVSVGIWPRKIQVIAPGCTNKKQDYPIGRAQLRASNVITLQFSCGGH